jgi:hypothetical protein
MNVLGRVAETKISESAVELRPMIVRNELRICSNG